MAHGYTGIFPKTGHNFGLTFSIGRFVYVHIVAVERDIGKCGNDGNIK